jgi:hypothetical protein
MLLRLQGTRTTPTFWQCPRLDPTQAYTLHWVRITIYTGTGATTLAIRVNLADQTSAYLQWAHSLTVQEDDQISWTLGPAQAAASPYPPTQQAQLTPCPLLPNTAISAFLDTTATGAEIQSLEALVERDQ